MKKAFLNEPSSGNIRARNIGLMASERQDFSLKDDLRFSAVRLPIEGKYFLHATRFGPFFFFFEFFSYFLQFLLLFLAIVTQIF